MHEDLKYYERYLKKLTAYANAIGLKVVKKSYESEGALIPSRKKIVLDNDLSQTVEIAVFLHELGHAIDMMIHNDQYQRIDEAYTAKSPTKHQKKTIMDCEKAAWDRGRDLARVLKIRLGKWYDETEIDCLKSYKES